MRATPWSLSALAPLLITACASTPIRYHTLVPSLGNSPSVHSSTYRLGERIKVEEVSVPSEVDRSELVVRQPDGGVTLWENHLWLAPLPEEVKAALLAEMQQRLALTPQSDRNAIAPWVSLRIDIARFEAVPGRYAAIEANWELRVRGRYELALSCRTSAYEDVGSGAAALVRGQQRAIILLADQISESVEQFARGAALECPAT